MNATPANTLGSVFHEVVTGRPEHTALIAGDLRLSYGRLAGWAGALAGRLAGTLEPEELVGICAARSPGTIATLLGVVLAGGACLPLDPRSPEGRLRMLIEDSGTRTVFAARQDVPRLRALLPEHVEILPIDESPPEDPAPFAPVPQSPDVLGYVIYTSGSTGRPKGVLVEQRSVLGLVRSETAGLGPDDVLLQLAPLHADPSVFEMWGALLNGATLVLPEQPDPTVHDIGRAVTRHGVSVLRLAAPLFRLAVEHITPELRGLRLLISGGDRAYANAVRKALRELPGCRVVNGYGPTETTVYACWQVLAEYDESWPDVPIGRPVAGASAHVLGPDRRPVAPGDEGELCVGGAGVARGYLGRPELTAERFIPEPGRPELRAYLTGDRVRLLPDGNLAFLGRLDDQVKIRGHRVEPGEVERVLLAHPAVGEAAVVVQGDAWLRRLAAFVSPAAGRDVSQSELTGHLGELLPDHMVPAAVTVLPALPVTANGKTDRGLLARTAQAVHPEAGGMAGSGAESVRTVAAIWRDVLGGPADPDTGFLAAGGDSLSAMVVLARLERATGVALSVAELFEAATVRELAARVDAADPARPAAPRTPRERVPLLPGQEGIWFEQQAAPGGRYNISRTFLVRGPLDVSALRTALTRLADRQRALRTVVEHDTDGGWWQSSSADPGAALRHLDLGSTPVAGRETRARELIGESAAADPADPATPLVRTLVLTLDPVRTVLHFDIHHVIADDWSLDLFFGELSALYEALLRSAEPDTAALPALEFSFADHVLDSLDSGPRRAATAREFWAQALDGGAAALDLVTDAPRPGVLSGAGDRVRLRIGPEQTARLAGAARGHGVSRFMFCLAGVYTVLSGYAEQDDLCLGSLVTGRGRAGTERLIGYFVNMLPIRVSACGDTRVATLLKQVREACVAAYRHQDVPFQTVCRDLGVTGAARGSIPFQAVVNYQQRQPRPLTLGAADVESWRTAAGDTAKFELFFAFQETGDAIDIELEFSTDLYREDTVRQLGSQLIAVLDRLAGGEDTTLRELELFAPGERQRLCSVPEPERTPAGTDATLHELFARQAAALPEKPAVVGDDLTLTYRELDRLSDGVAARLAAHGIRAGDRVAICLDRSPRLIVAILGVLKSGAAYVPLDPSYPAERLRYTVEDVQARVLVSAKEISDALFRETFLEMPGAIAVLDIERLTAPADEAATMPPTAGATPAAPAYIIYTSGSTGRPRGVVIGHRSVVNTLYGNLARHPFAATDVWLQLTSPGFDVAVYEQFMPLVSGGTLVYCDDATRGDGPALTRVLRERGVTVMVTVPSLLRALGRPDLAGVRVLMVAGEPADVHDTRHFARDRVVINGYGPTEAAILATTYRVSADDDDRSRVPVGRPLPGTRAHVIDRHGRFAATGVPGELYLGGAGVGHGYWNNPEQTEKVFTTAPVVGPDERLYRTGDRVRWLPDGNIDFLGRLDGQIKLRGFRIELGEIEAALATHPGVREAVAVIEGSGPDAELAAFYVGPADERQAREHLARLLPGHMVPRLVVPVGTIPTSTHGKADRTALAARLTARHPAAPDGRDPAAGAGPGELRMLTLWQEVLGTPVGSLDDDFFALGGHSLRLIRLLGLIERQCGTRIPVRDFLAAPTVRATAGRLAGRGAGASATVGPADAVLDPGIVFTGCSGSTGPPAPGGGPVLLTGVTGFVGAYVLQELLERTDDQVLCLVRADSPGAARRRIEATATRYRLGFDPHDARIVPVPGDLALPGLGLAGTQWERAAREAATVFHVGAQVHHLSGFQHLAAANVRGTEELLRIAAVGRPARFHHISTLGVFRAEGPPRVITEATPLDGERHARGRGYVATKWAAEQLVAQAVARGAHARVYRLGRAGGSTGNGALSLDDMLTRMLVTSAALGCYPADSRLTFDVLPVDVMARALVTLALADGAPGTVHHLHHPRELDLGAFMDPYDRRADGRTDRVDLAEWIQRLGAAAEAGTELPALAYLEHLRELHAAPHRGGARHDNRTTLAALRAHGITPPDLDYALVSRWWDFLEDARATLSTRTGETSR
ncbi:amino acid adenylation domain-containing protein [Streptomyces sp. ISL-98]|uniref:non-ribosomal peptide synthetase n=1 Tax=Streptomyces sp. ISL-98 TaxID=2819192 RepID=UPI001BEC369B|nr:non-ribosomal peptide synthetase [Streptomyces sp. ISL-98]MBT2508657.1 amino acid adenylation domain-containing protein [Streptomyces sp. ISL-98]